MTPEELRQLGVALDYEQRYHIPVWAGRDRIDAETLDRLADRGLLRRQLGDHATRWLYSVTMAGRRALGR